MQLIENVLKKEKTAIVLVPEISLTPQMVDRFIARFGEETIAVLHSKLSVGERYDQWNKIKNGDIILITTHIKGLDTSHLGFAWKKEGKTYLLHASSKGKQVMISSLPLQEYMEGIDSQSGIMLARAAKTLAE